MSTRGLLGHKIDGVVRGMYNHYGSYPEGLGVEVFKLIRDMDWDIFKDRLQELHYNSVIDRDIIDGIERYTEIILGKTDFYPEAIDFIKDSLFCEWAYIMDFDEHKLDIYRGFQKSPTKGNIFGETPNKQGYYPCKLIKTIDFNEIISTDEDYLITTLDHELGVEYD